MNNNNNNSDSQTKSLFADKAYDASNSSSKPIEGTPPIDISKEQNVSNTGQSTTDSSLTNSSILSTSPTEDATKTTSKTTIASDEPLKLAVVGHTNTGKTSILRTLLRDVYFGEVKK